MVRSFFLHRSMIWRKSRSLPHLGATPELGDDEAKDGGRMDSGVMKVDGAVAVLGEGLDKDPQEGGFADPGLPDHQGKRALAGEVFEPGHGLGEAVIISYPVEGRGFLEGMGAHFEVVEEHGFYSFRLRISLSSKTT